MILLTNILIISSGFTCLFTIWGVYRYWSFLLIPLFSMGLLMLATLIPFSGSINTFLIYTSICVILVYGYVKENKIEI